MTLSAPSAKTVTVAYATSDGTATAPGDYTPASGTLTFTPGQTSQTFMVSVMNDALAEPTETINLALASPGNAILGTQGTATLTITDDDPPPKVRSDNRVVGRRA